MLDEDINSDSVFYQFLNGFSEILNYHAPLKPQIKNEIRLKTEPGMNNGILKSIKEKKCYGLAILHEKRPDID